MAFNYNAAIQAGYSPDEIDQYLSKNNGGQQQQAQPNFFQNILGGLKSFGLGAVQDIAAPAYLAGQELLHGQNPITGMGNKPNVNQLQQYASSNPFASKQQLQGMGGNLSQAATQVGQDTAGAASYMVPFGRGANILSKALLPGAASGVLQGASNPNANPASIALNGATGMAGGAIGHGAGALIGKAAGVLPKVGQTISDQADPLLRSQYSVSPSISRDLSLPEATQFLANNYGIFNKDQAVGVANKVIPLLTSIRNQAIKNLPTADLGNINNVINKALEPAVLVGDNARSNFLNHVKQTLNYSADGTNIVDNNPQKVMYGISQLESAAHNMLQSKDPASQQLGHAYVTVARTMEDRLGNGYINPDSGVQAEGINGVPIKDLLMQKGENGTIPLEDIHTLNPHLGMAADNIETLRELRHLEAPFVTVSRAAQAAEDVNKHNSVSPLGLLGALGLYHMNPALAGAYVVGRSAINSNAGKTAFSKGAMKVGNTLQKTSGISPYLQSLLSGALGKGAATITNAANQ